MWNLIKIGDRVIVKECGDKVGKIISFAEFAVGRVNNRGRRPGIYINPTWLTVKLEDGAKVPTQIHLVTFADPLGYERRIEMLRRGEKIRDDFLRDLPETPFWEGDLVRMKNEYALTRDAKRYRSPLEDKIPELRKRNSFGGNTFIITEIEYLALDSESIDADRIRKPFPAYSFGKPYDGNTDPDEFYRFEWWCSARADELELVERGKIWKDAHA